MRVFSNKYFGLAWFGSVKCMNSPPFQLRYALRQLYALLACWRCDLCSYNKSIWTILSHIPIYDPCVCKNQEWNGTKTQTPQEKWGKQMRKTGFAKQVSNRVPSSPAISLLDRQRWRFLPWLTWQGGRASNGSGRWRVAHCHCQGHAGRSCSLKRTSWENQVAHVWGTKI